jgi:hypothetical protein
MPQNKLGFGIPVRLGVPEFSFITIASKDVFDAFMLLPVVLPALTHLFNFIFTRSEFPSRWKCAVVLPIPKVSYPSDFSDFRPISLLP